MLKEMGFGDRWRGWIQSCVSTATLAVLVNGSPTEFFQIQKGLRQGDPLSPLLFNLCVNAMSCMLNQLLVGDVPCGVNIGGDLIINHLQFADDSLLFCECDLQQVRRIAMVMEVFLLVSGLKVNFQKSSLIGVNVSSELEIQAATVLGFKREQLPIVYLGLPLGGRPRRVNFWKPVLETMDDRLASWNSKFLSMSGRVVMLRAVISALPLYYMSVFKAPIGVIKEMEIKMRRFLWGGRAEDVRKISWVGWEDICKSHRFGGLGVGFLGWKNKALLLKWMWRFGREKGALWRRIICLKYGLNLNCIMPHFEGMRMNVGSCIVQDLMVLWREQSPVVTEFVNGLACRIGDGRGVRFWTDVWCGEVSLQIAFPRVFAVSSNKQALVGDVGRRDGNKWVWELDFRRSFFDWELEQYNTFFKNIQDMIYKHGPDKLLWRGETTGEFSVKALCGSLEDKLFSEPEWVVPSLIRKLVPTKVATFMWQLEKDRVASKANLLVRGINLPDEGLCGVCHSAIETSPHLFLHCPVVWGLWCKVLQREGVIWVVPHMMKDLLGMWADLRCASDRVMWDMIPYALCWSIWLERNGLIFNDKGFSADSVWDMHSTRIAWWVKSWWWKCPYSVMQFATGFQHIALPKKDKDRGDVQWEPPVEPFLKFNVDGSSLGTPGKSGVGGVLRNCRGEAVGFFALEIGIMWAYEAEVHAIYHALVFCKQFNFSPIIIESDCKVAVGWVQNEGRRPWRLLHLLDRIDILLPEVNCKEIRHVLREGNEEADFLAKSGRDGEILLWQICD